MTLTQGLIQNLLFLDISGGELLIILIVAFLVFGPQRIPEIARKLGRGMSEIKKASNQIRNEITREVKDVKNAVQVDFEEPLNKEDLKTKAQPADSGAKPESGTENLL